ncbi:LysR substrate-binding domain-containing protein [Paracoccus sp. M683]|uniref:LysR substrate-binding domain-containing protein n=1 Tax=Paracoccus sp. M683 TaxID=2594268 RepID=UPI001C8F4223|nr:LysR substrate-binding domain-containing protein [Paracoccus sp. M683]
MIFERDGERVETEAGPYQTNDGESMITMMRAGMGIGQSRRAFLQPCLDRGELVAVLPDWTRPALTMHAIYPPSRRQNGRLRAFLDWLAQQQFQTT